MKPRPSPRSNVCQIYDVGPNYLVMEYIEGTPLKGPLPVDETLKYAVQICDALDAAHKQGITHRDLKPANILATRAGIKLLDFGLAKLGTSGIGQAVKAPSDATLTMALTGKNEIVGTLYYMSPEQLQAQATGQEIDGRSDIFSFGLVLYEMLSGKRAFEGSSPASVIAAIIERPAPSVADVAPPALDRVLQRCLAKDPENRWQSARDLKAALGWAAAPEFGSAVPAAKDTGPRLGRLPWIVAAGIFVLAAALGFTLAGLRNDRAHAIQPVNLSIALPQGQFVSALESAALAISADGKRVVYHGSGPNGYQLYLRDLDSFRTTPMPGTQGALNPFFSPDGQWVAFTGQGKLNKVALTGGAVQVICDSFGANGGGAWDSDGNIYFSTGVLSPAFRVSAAGGPPQAITRMEGEEGASWPQLLPGGKTLLKTTWTTASFDDALIEAVNLSTGQRRVLITGGSAARFVPPDFLIYARAGKLMMARFDPERLEVKNTPVQVLGDLMTVPSSGAPQFDISATGTLVYLSASAGIYENNLDWIERGAKPQSFGIKPGLYQSPRFSPDGRKVALTVRLPSPEIWIYDLNRGTLQQMTFAPGENEIPVWSPDSRQIAYAGNGRKQAYVFPVDGSSPERAIASIPDHFHLDSWSADGSLIALEKYVNRSPEIWMLPTAGNRQPYRYMDHAIYPAFSPDGHWLAYVSGDLRNYNVYIQRFPGPGERIQVSTEAGLEPVWSRDGRELYFESGDTLFGVDVATTPNLVVGKPEVVYQGHFWHSNIAGPNYDVAPDGKRVLMVDSDPEPELTQIHVVLNWTA